MIRITTLVEDNKGEHLALRNEHGLSFHIDTGRDVLLFDTGQSDAVIHNANLLRIALGKVDRVVLSHGHYDHTAGLPYLHAAGMKFELFTGQGFFADKYAELGPAYEFVGNSFDESWLREAGIRHTSASKPIEQLVPGVHLITDFPRVHADEVGNPRFKLQEDGAFVDDPFTDEVMLAIETGRGLVAVVGCSHPGIKNMLDAATERLGMPIYAVLGGTHLIEASPGSVSLTMDYFEHKSIQVIGASHCTGPQATERLSDFGSRFYSNHAGTCLILE